MFNGLLCSCALIKDFYSPEGNLRGVSTEHYKETFAAKYSMSLQTLLRSK